MSTPQGMVRVTRKADGCKMCIMEADFDESIHTLNTSVEREVFDDMPPVEEPPLPPEPEPEPEPDDDPDESDEEE